MRVLFVNHTGRMSGGEHSLVTVLRGLPAPIEAALASPRGELSAAAHAIGLRVLAIPEAEGSLKLHPLRTPLALLAMALAAGGVVRAARAFGADVVHANSIRAGMIAGPAARLAGAPAVTYVRDALPPGRASALALRLVGATASLVLPNSRYTAARFEASSPGAAMRVLPSPVDLERFDPGRLDRAAARRNLGIPASTFAFGVVAQITPWKGQDVAIEAVATVKRRHPDVRLLLVGSAKFVGAGVRHDNVAFHRRLEELVRELGVEAEVAFLGERPDVPAVLRGLAALLAPSWEEPLGRAIMEGMAMELPVIATSRGGPPELIEHEVDGLLAPPRQPERWAEAALRLLERPEERRELARRARERALANFGMDAHVRALLSVYDEVLAQ